MVNHYPKDWRIVLLSELSIEGFQNGLFYEVARKNKGIPIINVGDLYKSSPIANDKLELFNATAEEIKRYQVFNGDLFFTRSSIVPSGIAFCNWYRCSEKKAVVFDSHVVRFKTNTDVVNPMYLYLACIRPDARKYFLANAKTATMTTIDQTVLGRCPIPYPALKEQTAIAEAVSDADNLIFSLQKLIEKACREHFVVTLVFPILQERKRHETEYLLEMLDNWCGQHQEKLEIVVNDWGTAALAAERKNFMVCLGILLNKRKKDPRMKYKQGNDALFRKNSLNAEFYRTYLKENFGIDRYEWESFGFPQIFPSGENSLHFPFYQTNTSQHCTLYAECVNGNRGAQEQVTDCPRYCERQAFLYPKHLQMMGRYNSLFALAPALFQNPAEMGRAYAAHGVKRFVLNLL